MQRRSGRTWLFAFAIGTLTHLALDEMWRNPQTLFWPLFNDTIKGAGIEDWFGGLWHALVSNPHVFIPELIGFIALAWFGLQLLRRRRVGAFLKRGDVA